MDDKKILVLDDEIFKIKFYNNLLKKFGYHAFGVNNIDEAFEMYVNNKFNKIIVDHTLNGDEKGYQFVNKVFNYCDKNGFKKPIFISSSSSNTNPEIRKKYEDIGVSFFLNASEIKKSLEKTLREADYLLKLL